MASPIGVCCEAEEDCSHAFVENDIPVINERLNLALSHILDDEVDSAQESVDLCVSTMSPTDQGLQDDDIYTGQTSSNINYIFDGEEIGAIRNTQKDLLSIHSPRNNNGDCSHSGENTTSHFAKDDIFDDLLERQIKADEANCNAITTDVIITQIYNCDYNLHLTPRKSPIVTANINIATPKSHEKGLLQSKSVKIHDTYKNFIDDFKLEICTDWKRKPKRKRRVVDRFKQLRSKYVRLQQSNVMCHLRCQIPLDDIVDKLKESTKRLMDPKQIHSNSKIMDSMYKRNLFTRQKSTDKNLFNSALSPPEALRQILHPSEILNDSDINIPGDALPDSPAPIPFFDKSDQKEISERYFSNHDQNVTVRKKGQSRSNSNSSLINESHTSSKHEHNKMSAENEHSDKDSQNEHSNVDSESEHSNMNFENKHSNMNCQSEHSNMDSESEHSNMDCQSEHSNMDCENEHNNQPVYILSQENGFKTEELKIFVGGNLSSSSKRKILYKFFNQQNPRANFSSTSKSHLKNNKAISAKRSPFSRILEKSLASEEWNECGVFEKLKKLWSFGSTVSFEMLLKEAPLGLNPAFTVAKIFTSLINLKTSHFVEILETNEGKIKSILKGPASRERRTYHPYSM